MSDWSVDGVVDNTWSSLDEVTWIEREDKGDCIVPESRLLRPTSCISVETLRRVSGESLQQVTKPPSDHFDDANVKEEQYDQGNSHESKYISEDTAACSKGVAWCESAPSVLPLKTIERGAGNGSSALGGELKKGNSCYVYEGTTEMCNGESGYYSNGVDILNGSCNFFPSDICPSEGDLEFLAEEGQEDGRRDNLLEYGWGNTSNMEDMEKLFPSTDSLLMRGFDTEMDGMLWEPPLGDSLEVINPSVKVSVSPKFASRRDMKDMDTQVHFSSGNSVTTLNEDAPNSGVAMEGKQEMFTCLNPSSLSTNMENYSNSGDLKTWDARLSHNHRSSAEYCEGSNDDEPHLSIDVQKVAGTSGSSLCLSDSERTRVFEEGEKKMDTRTRLCLRDGFRRLARNAMQRRAAGDRGGSVTGNTEPLNRSFVAESSSSSEQACSQRLLTVEDIVETETNPMDRFIADFLFHKRCPPPSSTPSYVSGTPPCNMSPNSQPTIVNQAVWAWLEANPLSPGVSPATHSSSADGDLGTFTSPNVETDRQASPHPGSCPGQVVILPQAPAMGSMQHPLDRDRDMINMDPEPLGNVNSLDDVKEPLLQAE